MNSDVLRFQGAARQPREDAHDAQARPLDGDAAAPHLADADRRGVDQGRGVAEGLDLGRLRQEEQRVGVVVDGLRDSRHHSWYVPDFYLVAARNMDLRYYFVCA